MASSPEQSLAQESDVLRNTDSGISVNLLLFGGNLVEKAFQEAMEEVHTNTDNEVTFLTYDEIVFILWYCICSSKYRPIEVKFLKLNSSHQQKKPSESKCSANKFCLLNG